MISVNEAINTLLAGSHRLVETETVPLGSALGPVSYTHLTLPTNA